MLKNSIIHEGQIFLYHRSDTSEILMAVLFKQNNRYLGYGYLFQTVKDYMRDMVRLVRSRHRRCDSSDILMAASPDAVPEEVFVLVLL